MAISWLAVLQSVPWTDVIANAPKVADGAKKLWKTVGKRRDTNDSPVPEFADAISQEAGGIAELRTKVSSLDAAVLDLQGQMLASSELIKDLAEQNTQLITRIEVNRRRTLWLAGAFAIVVAAVCAVLFVGRSALH